MRCAVAASMASPLSRNCEQLRRAQAHILEGLVDEQLVECKLVGRNVLEAPCMRLYALVQFLRWADIRDQADAVRGRRIDGVTAQQELLGVLEA